ncbi:unnamed protein product, partial [Ascophyllum nodosum]
LTRNPVLSACLLPPCVIAYCSSSTSRKMDELAEEMRATNKRLASLEQDARQPRLAMEADVPADKKTRKRTEGAATAVQAKHG